LSRKGLGRIVSETRNDPIMVSIGTNERFEAPDIVIYGD
jgi:hypothetical protein